MSEAPIYSVSGATAIIKDRLEDLAPMMIEGEVSNLHSPNSAGHLYFALSDAAAKINVTFFAFRQKASGERIAFENGSKLRVFGRISLYAPSGSYQLNAERIERCDGTGALLKKFEDLKRKLFAEGLCESSRKRKLPLLPRRIGIVTAPTGAAIRDILSILGRRYPNLHILIAPARVQGTGAAEEIASAIEFLNAHFGPESQEPLDAMIVGRGGGSLEDLWCFNEERVARAVALSRIAVISAVGHEPDTAITDFVADVRAPTPSAAAEMLCGRKEDFEKALAETKERLLKALRAEFMDARNQIQQYNASALFRDPVRVLENKMQRVDGLDIRQRHALETVVAQSRRMLDQSVLALERARGNCLPQVEHRIATLEGALHVAVRRAFEGYESRLRTLNATLMAYNPYAVLARGYSLTTNAQGVVIKTVGQVQPGERLMLRVSDGTIAAEVSHEKE
ncbi:MAG: exodeoxyribonuclease VII large subunit [Kiritimatiellia bacterium]